MTGNADKQELMFELESDRFLNLRYSEHDFKTEAGAVKGEYTKNSPAHIARSTKSVQKPHLPPTPTHTHTMGYFKDIVDMPNQYEYSKKFFDRYYRPEYNTILVVGDVTPSRSMPFQKNTSVHGNAAAMYRLCQRSQSRPKHVIHT